MSDVMKVRVSVRIGPYARRDKFAAWLANQALRLASHRYRAMVKGAIALGLETAAMEPQPRSRPDGEPGAGEPRGGQGEQGEAGQAREHGGTPG